MLPYRLILIFASIIIRNIRKIKFSFKVLPRFFKSGREFESRALNVLTKQYYFICGRCPVSTSLQLALNIHQTFSILQTSLPESLTKNLYYVNTMILLFIEQNSQCFKCVFSHSQKKY